MPAPSSYTIELTPQQAQKLQQLLKERSFLFREVPYADFAAGNGRVQIVSYQSGKCVIQGKGMKEFVEFVLEPEVTGTPRMGYEKELNPIMFEPHIGTDESGKGDFFGPLVIAGVYADARAIETFLEIGVKDSKSFSSDKKIEELAKAIQKIPSTDIEVISISPAKYNQLQRKMGSVNEVMGWGHARVIENLLERTNCPRVVSDQFARTEWTIKKHLGERGRQIVVEQRHKAESDLVVAAASIIARARFVAALKKLSLEYGVRIPLGASKQVKDLARELLKKHGTQKLSEAVKTHFKTWQEIADSI